MDGVKDLASKGEQSQIKTNDKVTHLDSVRQRQDSPAAANTSASSSQSAVVSIYSTKSGGRASDPVRSFSEADKVAKRVAKNLRGNEHGTLTGPSVRGLFSDN